MNDLSPNFREDVEGDSVGNQWHRVSTLLTTAHLAIHNFPSPGSKFLGNILGILQRRLCFFSPSPILLSFPNLANKEYAVQPANEATILVPWLQTRWTKRDFWLSSSGLWPAHLQGNGAGQNPPPLPALEKVAEDTWEQTLLYQVDTSHSSHRSRIRRD